MNAEQIGKRIKALMEVKSLKRCYLAKELDISYNTLTKKLNGKREFTVAEILKIQEILGVNGQIYGNILFNENFL